jgi:hypothetical protein
MALKKNSVMAMFALALLVCSVVSVQAESTSGLSIGAGAGVMVAVDKESYFDKGTDFYPEAFVSYDKDSFLAELSVGWLYKKATITSSIGNVILAKADYTQSFVPTTLTLKYLPLRKNNSASIFQPYVGLGAGCLFATGDNNKIFFVISPDLGLSFGTRNILELDCAYNLVVGEKDMPVGNNLDYLKFGLRYKYRFAFKK